MPRKRLTARSLAAIKPPKSGRVEYWDTGLPLCLRVSDKGNMAWSVMYRLNGIQRRLSLGTYKRHAGAEPGMGLLEAREGAREALDQVRKGRDPSLAKKASREAGTFAELAKDYIEEYAKPNKRSWKKDERIINRELLPKLKHVPAVELQDYDHVVINLLAKITARPAPIMANRVHEIIRRIYSWGITQRKLPKPNPFSSLERNKENEGERVLTDDQIRAMWTALDDETPIMAAHFKTRLFTLQRGIEVSHMAKADLEREDNGAWWNIPGSITKNGKPHLVWLSEPALAIVDAAIAAGDPDSKWVFPSPREKRGAITDEDRDPPLTVVWKAAGRIRKTSKVEFTPHDLRRTASTKLTGELGIPRFNVKKILNHLDDDKGATKIYDRYAYAREKRQALDAWGTHLLAILANKKPKSNVVPIKQARQ